jgi:hypothetical protein
MTPVTQVSPAPLRSRLVVAASGQSYRVWFPLTVYALTRLIDLVFMLVATRHLAPGTTYGSLASNWDGHWYMSIANHGYPSTLPRGAGGQVLQNQWGFYPAYPLIAGTIMHLSRLGFAVVAPTLSLLLGAAAVTVMFRLINQGSGRFAASATVLLTCTYMAAPAMQIAYTESLALLLICTALLLLRNRCYGWLVPVLVTLALTRAIALAFVPVLMVHAINRYRHRAREPFPKTDRWRVVALTLLTVALTGLWPAIAALATGDPAAYTQTMSAWGTTGKLRVVIEFPAFAWAEGGVLGLAVLLAIIAIASWLVLRRGARAWDPEVRAWAGFYPIYLLLANAPGSSNVRYLLLGFPLLWPFPEPAAAGSERRFRMILIAGLVFVGITMQWVWISSYLAATMPSVWYP